MTGEIAARSQAGGYIESCPLAFTYRRHFAGGHRADSAPDMAHTHVPRHRSRAATRMQSITQDGETDPSPCQYQEATDYIEPYPAAGRRERDVREWRRTVVVLATKSAEPSVDRRE